MTIALAILVIGILVATSFKKSVRRTLAHFRLLDEIQAKRRSQAIDRFLQQDAVTRRAQYNVLPLGSYSMREAINQLQTKGDASHASQLHERPKSTTRHPFVANGVHMNLIDVGTQCGERRKWIHQFQNVDVVLYVVDLACYDLEVSSGSAMQEQLVYFESALRSRWFVESTFVLFLSNVGVFREKVVGTPLGKYYPGFAGGSEEEYLRALFRGANREGKRLYMYFVNPFEVGNTGLIAAAIFKSRGLGSKEKDP